MTIQGRLWQSNVGRALRVLHLDVNTRKHTKLGGLGACPPRKIWDLDILR